MIFWCEFYSSDLNPDEWKFLFRLNCSHTLYRAEIIIWPHGGLISSICSEVIRGLLQFVQQRAPLSSASHCCIQLSLVWCLYLMLAVFIDMILLWDSMTCASENPWPCDSWHLDFDSVTLLVYDILSLCDLWLLDCFTMTLCNSVTTWLVALWLIIFWLCESVTLFVRDSLWLCDYMTFDPVTRDSITNEFLTLWFSDFVTPWHFVTLWLMTPWLWFSDSVTL